MKSLAQQCREELNKIVREDANKDNLKQFVAAINKIKNEYK
ncbi:hypothetical protein [Paenibacillus contaminans]|nr:hypothetical protein [Paenibacillus contaminans]